MPAKTKLPRTDVLNKAADQWLQKTPAFATKGAIKRFSEGHCLTAALAIQTALKEMGHDSWLEAGWREVYSNGGDYRKLSHVVAAVSIEGFDGDLSLDCEGTDATERWEESWNFEDEDGDEWEFDWQPIRVRSLEAFAKKNDIKFDRKEAEQIAITLVRRATRTLTSEIEANRKSEPDKAQQRKAKPRTKSR